MKFSSIIFSSFIALCVTTSTKGKIIDNISDGFEPLPIDTLAPIKECAPGEESVLIQRIQCRELNGLFYQKFSPFPFCSSDFVCFIPADDDENIHNCVKIEGGIYCSAGITNIKSCRSNINDYNFIECLLEAKEIFPDLEYNLIYIYKPTTVSPTSRITPGTITRTFTPLVERTISFPPLPPVTRRYRTTSTTTTTTPSKTKTVVKTLTKISFEPVTDLYINPTLFIDPSKIVKPTIDRPTYTGPIIVRPTETAPIRSDNNTKEM